MRKALKNSQYDKIIIFSILQTNFSLTDYKHSNGKKISIIKDWKIIINQVIIIKYNQLLKIIKIKVKDNQILLTSLKSSPYYNQFKDQTSIWEKRYTLFCFLCSLIENNFQIQTCAQNGIGYFL